MENELITFVEKFFENLGATVLFANEILLISNVPNSFEKFYGKTPPYQFTIIKEIASSDIEFLEKGSYTLKSIASYLENAAQTTLLKIDFEITPETEITKRLSLENAHIGKLDLKKRYGFVFRFTFNTIFQYLNEKEKITNDLYVIDNEVIEGNLKDYPIEEGDKREVRIPDIKEQYFLAKEELKKRIKDKTFEVASKLNLRLESEKERIERHFFQESKEVDENLEKATNKLLELIQEADIEKISKQKRIIDSIRIKKDFQELEKDKNRAIQLEKQKHMLNINNKLLNTTVIYYPLFTYDAHLKNAETKRIVEISFDPIKEDLTPLNCEHCSKETKKISLCSTGHLSCEDCHLTCESCHKGFCKKCIKTTCELCSKKICRDCSARCFRCSKIVCKSHTKIDKVSGRIYCNNCLKRCERCSSFKDPYSFKVSRKTNVEICEECFRKEMQKGVLKGVFDN